MQAWQPRLGSVLERLSDRLLPRGTAAVQVDGFREIIADLERCYHAANQRGRE